MSIPHCPHLSKHGLIHGMFDWRFKVVLPQVPRVMKGRFAQILRASGRNDWKIDLPLGFQTPTLRRYDWTPKTYLKHRTSGGMTGRLMKTLEEKCQWISRLFGIHIAYLSLIWLIKLNFFSYSMFFDTHWVAELMKSIIQVKNGFLQHGPFRIPKHTRKIFGLPPVIASFFL